MSIGLFVFLWSVIGFVIWFLFNTFIDDIENFHFIERMIFEFLCGPIAFMFTIIEVYSFFKKI